MPPKPNADLIGKRYIDQADSGDLIMEVFAIDAVDPHNAVCVHPISIITERAWWRSADRVRELVAATDLTKTCTHPPTRIFTWFAYDMTLCAACCDCGEVLAGAAQPWRQITEDPEEPISAEELVFEAVTHDGYILGSACIEGFGPLAYAKNPQRFGYDTIAFCGKDDLDIVANGKPKAVKLLQQLIAYERRATP
jgi:hypothetical protein